MEVSHRAKLDDEAALCYYLNKGGSQPNGTVRILRASIGRIVCNKIVAWQTQVPRWRRGGGGGGSPCCTYGTYAGAGLHSVQLRSCSFAGSHVAFSADVWSRTHADTRGAVARDLAFISVRGFTLVRLTAGTSRGFVHTVSSGIVPRVPGRPHLFRAGRRPRF